MTQFYQPETGAASVRTAAVVRELVGRGYDATVVTAFPSFPTGVIEAPFRGRLYASEELEHVTVLRLWTYASPRLSRVDRMLNWLSFAASLLIYLLSRRRTFDLVYTSVGPITLMPLAMLAKHLYSAPLVADVRDVLPDRALHLKLWREDGPTTKLVGFLSSRFYAAADLIATVNSICREEIMTRCNEPGKIVVFPNGFDPVVPAATSPFQRLNGEFIASYVGNICQTSGVEVILDAARHLKDSPQFRFVIIGGGNESAKLEAQIKREELKNVAMLGVKKLEDAAAAQLASDVCIIPLRRDVSDTIPKKLYDALSLGRPVVVCANGAAKRFTTESGGGICVEPENGLELAQTIRLLAGDPRALENYARNGREFVSTRYNRTRLVREFADTLVGLNHRSDPSAGTGHPAASLSL